MSILVPNHKYLFDELGNAVAVDTGSTGGKNMTSITAGVERSGTSFTLDGVAEVGTWNAASNPLGDLSLDSYAVYTMFSVPDFTDVTKPIWSSGSEVAKPWLFWDPSATGNPVIAFNPDNNGPSQQNLQLTSDPAPSVIIAVMVSVDKDTGDVVFAIQTSAGDVLSVTDTVTLNAIGNIDFTIGKHRTASPLFGNFEYEEMGTYNDHQTLADIQETLAALINPPTTDTGLSLDGSLSPDGALSPDGSLHTDETLNVT